MDEIVAAQIGTIITTNVSTIRTAFEGNKVKRFITRREVQFMSCCDLGQNWDRLAVAPTLFCIDKTGKPQPRDYKGE